MHPRPVRRRGLFTAALADAVGATGTVVSIEGSPVTHKDARSNFAPDGCSRTENSADTRIEVIRGDVARHLVDLKTALEFGEIPAIDAVVLDPSREGANRTTLERLDALDPKRILYVACDPASLVVTPVFCVSWVGTWCSFGRLICTRIRITWSRWRFLSVPRRSLVRAAAAPSSAQLVAVTKQQIIAVLGGLGCSPACPLGVIS